MARRKLWKGLVAGSAAGLAGTIAMTQFQKLWSKASEKIAQNGSGSRSAGRDSAESESEDATMKAAGKVAEITGHRLSHQQKAKAGPIVHYAFGTGMGALYGATMELGSRSLRRHDLLSGIGFGGVLFAGADEAAIPALGLSGKPSDSPISSHLYALASHLVYGVTAGVVRKGIRSVL